MAYYPPQPTDRYAVVCPHSSGPDVSFWPDHLSIIKLMTLHARCVWSKEQPFSVWHRRTAKARWVCITN